MLGGVMHAELRDPRAACTLFAQALRQVRCGLGRGEEP